VPNVINNIEKMFQVSEYLQTPKKVLIAEDEKAIARAMQFKLSHSGFDVKVVYDGLTALNTLQSDEKFDLLLLDLVMPKMDGFTVLQELKNKNIKIPIVVISNLSQAEDERRVKELNALEYFVKSNTTLAEIVSYIKQAISNGK
jgi:CheY-like chemotaxis protein